MDERRAFFEREALPLLGRVLRVALHFTRDAEAAEDLVQETYLRAFERIEQFKQGTNMLGWLSRIVYTQFVDRYRKETRHGVHFGLNEAEAAAPPGDPAASVETAQLLRSSEFRAQLDEGMRQALDRLSPNMRDVLVLHVVGELRYREVSDLLDLPIGTVMSRLSRAKAFMRKALRESAPAESQNTLRETNP